MLLSNLVLYCIFCNDKHDENLMQQVNTAKDLLPEPTESENFVAKIFPVAVRCIIIYLTSETSSYLKFNVNFRKCTHI